MDWSVTLTPEGIDFYWNRCAERDPAFARKARAWWEGRTPADLRARMHEAWLANEYDAWLLAKSYLDRPSFPGAGTEF